MLFKREPARILALVSAVIAVAVGFGLPVTEEQVGLIMAAVALLIGEGTRSQVTPVNDPGRPVLRGRVTER